MNGQPSYSRRLYQKKTKNISINSKALFALSFVSIVWGTSYLFSKQGVRTMPALQLAGMRQLFAGSIFLVFFIIKKAPWPRGKQWFTIALLGMLNFFLSNGMSTWGVKFISSGLGAIIAAIFPLWLVLFLALKGERISFKTLMGLLIGFTGICIIFYDHLIDFLNPDFRFGIILSLAATISWALGTLLTKQQTANFNPYFSLGFQMFLSGVSLLLIVICTGNAIPLNHIPSIGWFSLAYLVTFGNICTLIAYIYTLKHLPTTLASIYAYINPIVAVLLGTIVLKEPLTYYIIIGGIITILGVYLVNSALRKKEVLQ